MTAYCSICNKITDIINKQIEETFKVKGEDVSFLSEVAECKDCKEIIFHAELDGKNIKTAYSIYRKKHNLLPPTQIANIREKYDLSQRALARLLEWGEITIHRYETGAIQDPAHNEVLLFISEPNNMKTIFEQNHHLLTTTQQESLGKKIDTLLRNEVKPNLLSSIQGYISCSQKTDEFSGFKRFDLEKTIQMILYVSRKNEGVFTTKLYKSLWYSDFLSFKSYSVSISGCSYMHFPFGPVPVGYEYILAAALDSGALKKEEIFFESGASGVIYRPIGSFDDSFFSKEEIEVMDRVISYFASDTCQKISEKSHKEQAYSKTCEGELISYKFAKTLSLSLE